MSIYYILAEVGSDLVAYTLNSTTSIEHRLPVESSSYSVEDGSDITDNFVLKEESITFSGNISDVRPLRSSLDLNDLGTETSSGSVIDSISPTSTKLYIEGLRELRKSKKLFTIYFSIDQPPLENVFFESITFSQDSSHGTLSTFYSSPTSRFKVDFTVRQKNVVEAARQSVIVAPELADPTASKTSGSSTGFDDPDADIESRKVEAKRTIRSGASDIGVTL